ncbi:MAG: twin-arginine translocase TatA/TatE family subunit [Gemmatimonadetes bacterium]|nr:twin-arginine translocase TatA/TatE family subunit [Gemmatimonadota bacterium]NNL30472.1 twin-arginine translocase TatA/TatE family subunit [Gemmatimonadota bacterium]
MNGLTSGLGLITFGVWEAVLVFGILMLLFGAKKLPDLARGLGSGIRNFKGELKAPEDEEGKASRDKITPE